MTAQVRLDKQQLKDKIRTALSTTKRRADWSASVTIAKAQTKQAVEAVVGKLELPEMGESVVDAIAEPSTLTVKSDEPKYVRCVGELDEFKNIYGCVFELLGTTGDLSRLRGLNATDVSIKEMRTEHTQPVPKNFKAKQIMNLQNSTRSFKQDALCLGYVHNPLEHGQIEKLSTQMTGPCPSTEHVELGMAQLVVSFQTKGVDKQRYLIVPVSTVTLYLSTDLSTDPAAEPRDFVERFEQFLSQVGKHVELVLVPIHADGHYTLLAVSQGKQVRYFDGLAEPKQACWAAAVKLCERMGVSMCIQRTNLSLQIGAECAMCAVHWAEGELRALFGEHPAIVGWPHATRMRHLRERVSTWCAGLERERARWAPGI